MIFVTRIRMRIAVIRFNTLKINKKEMAIITLKDVDKVYRTKEIETLALENVNLEIQKGEFVSIMGPSGCGKSTLLNIIGLLDVPTKGTVTIMEDETGKMNDIRLSAFRNRNIGFVFQSFHLIPSLNVSENVALPLAYRSGISAGERKEKVESVLTRLGLSHRMRHFPGQLSGGQCQRVAIARAIIGDPQIVLADEPTGNLDSNNGKEVMELLTELSRQGTTIVMVTHSKHDAAFAHRVVHLFDGSIVASIPR